MFAKASNTSFVSEVESVQGFFAMVGKGFKRMTAYRLNVVTFALGGLIALVIQGSIWGALYAQGSVSGASL